MSSYISNFTFSPSRSPKMNDIKKMILQVCNFYVWLWILMTLYTKVFGYYRSNDSFYQFQVWFATKGTTVLLVCFLLVIGIGFSL